MRYPLLQTEGSRNDSTTHQEHRMHVYSTRSDSPWARAVDQQGRDSQYSCNGDARIRASASLKEPANHPTAPHHRSPHRSPEVLLGEMDCRKTSRCHSGV